MVTLYIHGPIGSPWNCEHTTIAWDLKAWDPHALHPVHPRFWIRLNLTVGYLLSSSSSPLSYSLSSGVRHSGIVNWQYISISTYSFIIIVVVISSSSQRHRRRSHRKYDVIGFVIVIMKSMIVTKHYSCMQFWDMWGQSCPRVTFLGPDPTRPSETLTRPDPTHDCRQKVWPDSTRGPTLPPHVHSLIE